MLNLIRQITHQVEDPETTVASITVLLESVTCVIIVPLRSCSDLLEQ